jgi:hypothetical protein
MGSDAYFSPEETCITSTLDKGFFGLNIAYFGQALAFSYWLLAVGKELKAKGE